MRNLILAMVFSLFVAGGVWAQNPNPPAVPYILSGTPVTITGVVKAVPWPASQGLQVETDQGVVTVYGIGPRWYWQQMGVPYPTVGEDITVEGYEVTFPNGTTRIVATKMTVSGQTIVLRGEDGRPLWRGGPWKNRGRQQMQMNQGSGNQYFAPGQGYGRGQCWRYSN
ncbi:hypothetical protein [Thermodesulfatator autotrophicus]|uniref:Magnetosome protein MamS/MamX domain-containing protein n=1 Tax=Thermodesulfatator autotrophicus TaxID=1795632 RepID=A0A177E975_9BACT|nr:hypothetical protein [Thermodesulfatator autotrophicus]OAG28465.1 hypothetical protein TH606_01815 [Thermodesulfatator autotrophicus]